MTEKKYRLVTRSDFDGLVCAILLKDTGIVDDIKFVHPKDMQDGTILITDNDITTNLPYVEGVHLAFDHHASEIKRVGSLMENHIIDTKAPSAARVVFDHYGGKSFFSNISDDLMSAVDKSDAAMFSQDEILKPKGWVLMNFLMDSRTGLGRFRDFRISNYQLMMDLIEFCHDHDIDDVLALPDVQERTKLYFDHEEKFIEQIKNSTSIHKNLAVLDLKNADSIFAGNRFMIYALYPETNISIHVMWGLNELNTVFATGKSIINRTSKTNIGELMLSYGGGGHFNAGTCQVENEDADKVLGELIARINQDG